MNRADDSSGSDGARPTARPQLPDGITIQSWQAIGAELNGAGWRYPERDGAGNVIGHVRRSFGGEKRSEKGSKRGLSMPWPLPDSAGDSADDPIIIVEGATDAAAAIDLHFTAVGRPSATGGIDLLKPVVSGKHCVIVGEHDRSGIGEKSARELAQHLLECADSVKLVMPPAESKDLRQWKRAGLTAIELLRIIDRTPKVRPLKLDKTDPLDSARQCIDTNFIECGERTLQYHAGDFWRFDSPAYRAVESDELRQTVYRFAERAVGADGKPFKPTMRKVSDIVDAMRAETYLLPGPVPRWLNDSELPSGELLPCANGLLHIPMRELYPATPGYFTVNALDYQYNPDAPKPEQWIAFLQELWGDDAEAILLLQEWFGYVLTANLSLHKMLLLCGPKRSGKGTIGRVLTAMLGAANVCGPTLSSLTERFGLAPLLHKPLAIISDARLSGRADSAIVAERLLAISGEDSITIDRKHREAVTCTLPTRFMLLSNELPRIADSSGALASRFVVLTLRRSFYGCEDTALTGKLLAELPSILNWALEGWDRLHEQGRFTEPQSSAEAIEELADLGSPAQTFIRDCCEIQDGASIACGELYDQWRQWCDSVGRDHPGDLQRFSRDLHAAASSVRTSNPLRTANGRVRFFEGIRLKETTDDLPT